MDELTVKRAYITKPSTDKDVYHIAQASYHGQVADMEVITPYGVYSTLPLDSQMLVWNVNGVEENRVSMGNMPKQRFKTLKPGEVVVGSPQTRSNVFFATDGSITITQNQAPDNTDQSTTTNKNQQGSKSNTEILNGAPAYPTTPDQKKASIVIAPDGTITITTNKDYNLTTTGKMNFTAGQDITFHSDGVFKVTAADIILNGEHEPDS